MNKQNYIYQRCTLPSFPSGGASGKVEAQVRSLPVNGIVSHVDMNKVWRDEARWEKEKEKEYLLLFEYGIRYRGCGSG